MMDNRRINVTSEGRGDFDAVLGIAMQDASGDKVTRYAIHPALGMVVMWGPYEDGEVIGCSPRGGGTPASGEAEDDEEVDVVRVPIQRLPYPMGLKQLSDFAWGWLTQAGYPRVPDIDGDCEKAWRIHNSYPDFYSVAWITPTWATYGK